jgi:chemotaxis protein CheZ
MHDPLIARVKAEVSKIRYLDQGQDPLLTASEELTALKATTAAATDTILGIAEALLADIEAVRGVAGAGAVQELLTNMETRLGCLFEACGFQDLTGQRSTKVARLLESLDSRVGRVLDMLDHVEVPTDIAIQVQEESAIGEAALLNGPQAAGEGLAQGDIDALFS